MSRVAVIGASSQIAKDWIRSNALRNVFEPLLYVRDTAAMLSWLEEVGLADRYEVFPYELYGKLAHGAVLNFVGVGDPSRAVQMGGDILDITTEFDNLVIAELKKHRERRYLFISSGAVYGDNFQHPATRETLATYAVNNIGAQNYYAIAKLHAEVRHRALCDLAIVDVRVFNYFSRHQSLTSRFFIVDIINSIKTGTVLRTSPDTMSRDYLHPSDFYQLTSRLLAAAPQNMVVDCYTAGPVEKKVLLEAMRDDFGLRYEVVPGLAAPVNATGLKPHYYSTNKKAAEFGYQPAYSSLDTLREEISALLTRGEISE